MKKQCPNKKQNYALKVNYQIFVKIISPFSCYLSIT